MKRVTGWKAALAAAVVGFGIAVAVAAQQPAIVEWSPKNWVILGFSVGIFLLILGLLLASKIFSAGDVFFNRAAVRGHQNKEVLRSMQEIIQECIDKHDEDADSHFRLQATKMAEVANKSIESLHAHNADEFAHRRALAPMATRDEVNGASQVARNELNGAMGRMELLMEVMRKDIHRLAPEKFRDEVDFDATGGRKK